MLEEKPAYVSKTILLWKDNFEPFNVEKKVCYWSGDSVTGKDIFSANDLEIKAPPHYNIGFIEQKTDETKYVLASQWCTFGCLQFYRGRKHSR